MKKISLPHAELVFNDDHILRIKMNHSEEMDLVEMKELVDSVNAISEGKPFCCLADVRNSVGSSTNEARQYAADHSYPSNKIADAIVISSLAKKLMANFYIQFNKPKSPTRIFTSENEALEWLNGILKNKLAEKSA